MSLTRVGPHWEMRVTVGGVWGFKGWTGSFRASPARGTMDSFVASRSLWSRSWLVLFVFLLTSLRVLCQDQIRVPFAELRAGQFNYGLDGVTNITIVTPRDAYENGYVDDNGVHHAPGTASADAYLRDNPVPVVLGPDGFHLIDRHHRTMACYLLSVQYGVSSPNGAFPNYTYVTQAANFSALSLDDFWKAMEKGDAQGSYVWLNNRGVPSSPSNLPFIPGLTDDVLRDFSADIAHERSAYSIIEPAFYFQEFYWADYLRDKVFLSGAGWENAGGNPNASFVSSDYKAVVDEAVRLCHLPAARNLPGFVAVPEPSEVALMAVVGMFLVIRGAWMRLMPSRA